MEDRPDSAALLDAVETLLKDEVVPRLDGAVAYHARIAASIVAIVARQLRLGPAADATEQEGLASLVGQGGGPDMLADRLRNASLSIDDPAVADHLWRTTLAKLAIDQPRYPRLAQLGHSYDTPSDG